LAERAKIKAFTSIGSDPHHADGAAEDKEGSRAPA
jgi:hypothetical protein